MNSHSRHESPLIVPSSKTFILSLAFSEKNVSVCLFYISIKQNQERLLKEKQNPIKTKHYSKYIISPKRVMRMSC